MAESLRGPWWFGSKGVVGGGGAAGGDHRPGQHVGHVLFVGNGDPDVQSFIAAPVGLCAGGVTMSASNPERSALHLGNGQRSSMDIGTTTSPATVATGC